MPADIMMIAKAIVALLSVLCLFFVIRSLVGGLNPGANITEKVATLEASEVSSKASMAVSSTLVSSNDLHETARVTQSTATTGPTNFETLCSSLSSAGAETELAPVLLAKGQSLMAAGQTKDAVRALRQAIEVAVENGMADIHAMARLELAEICREDGDLTTACEHWHLAKQLFNEQSRTSSSTATDVRMRAHGCPTEWVLTEF